MTSTPLSPAISTSSFLAQQDTARAKAARSRRKREQQKRDSQNNNNASKQRPRLEAKNEEQARVQEWQRARAEAKCQRRLKEHAREEQAEEEQGAKAVADTHIYSIPPSSTRSTARVPSPPKPPSGNAPPRVRPRYRQRRRPLVPRHQDHMRGSARPLPPRP